MQLGWIDVSKEDRQKARIHTKIIFCGPEDNVKNPFEKVTVDDAVQETESDNKHEKYAEERYGKR